MSIDLFCLAIYSLFNKLLYNIKNKKEKSMTIDLMSDMNTTREKKYEDRVTEHNVRLHFH
jgi:hypothetical protein